MKIPSQESLELLLSTDLQKGADAILTLAREGGVAKQTYFHLVALKSTLAAANPEARTAIHKELRGLLPKVLQECASEDSGETAAAEAAAEEKKKFFLEQGTPRRVVLEATGLCKSYGDFTLNGIDASLHLGEITGLIGLNGNGKTTLLRILAGEMRPHRGSLKYYLGEGGSETTDWATIKHQLAYLPQELVRVPGTMRQALELAASVHGIRRARNEAETEYIIQRLGLAGYVNKSWNELPGGYKLRFSLARILIRKPKLILMDEPLASLDLRARNALLYDLRELAGSLSNPISILFSSQHIEEVEAVSHKIYLLSAGKKIFYGPTFSIYKDRAENTYELESDLNWESLQSKLAGFGSGKISHTGFSYLVTTPKEVSVGAFMSYLSNQQIPVRAVRDISTSVRKYLL